MENRAVERMPSLQSQVFDHLLDAIMTGRLSFGTLLSEKVIAAELSISKTPVREAFVQLQALHLLDTKPQRGWLVFQPTFREVRELCEVRIVLEVAALRAAVFHDQTRLIETLANIHRDASAAATTRTALQYQNLDDAFHLELFRTCNNDTLMSAYEVFRPRIHALRVNLQNQNPDLLGASSNDHADIIARIAVNQIDAAAEIITRHVRQMAKTYSTHWDSLVGDPS